MVGAYVEKINLFQSLDVIFFFLFEIQTVVLLKLEMLLHQ